MRPCEALVTACSGFSPLPMPSRSAFSGAKLLIMLSPTEIASSAFCLLPSLASSEASAMTARM